MTEFQGMGTIYLIPMWASSWKRLENETESRDFNKYYLKNPLYCLAAKIDGELINDPDFHINVREFACNFDIKVVNLKGSVEITKQSTWMPEIVQLENNNEAGLNFHLKIV